MNPTKNMALGSRARWHRVICPVYIPEDAGFFAQSAAVLRLCLNSLLRTTGEETGITVVVNAASEGAQSVLQETAFGSGRCDVIWRAENVGKVEALFSALRGYHEPLVTLTDCDVLFLPGWLERVVHVFEKLPMVGAVSALPVPHLRRSDTGSTYLGAAIRGLLHTGGVASVNDLKRFMEDLESPNLISPRLLQRQPAIVRDGLCVLIGCTHMECTFRREALLAAPKERCNIAMGKDSERRWMDLPPDLRGWWKVSLPAAFVRHLGNTMPEDIPSEWDEIGRLFRASAPPGRRAPEAVLPWRVRNRIGRIVQWWVERSL